MSGADDIYQSLILDHSRAPRNFGPLAGANRTAARDNPLCGDRFTVAIELGADERIAAIAFEGTGCAISMASASMMTASLAGRPRAEAQALAARFDRLVAGEDDGCDTPDQPALGDLAAFATVARFAVRRRCARLPWEALLVALEPRNS